MRGYGFGASDVGRRRLSNEDAFLVDNDLGLYAVADGMGGHNAGDVASQEALDALRALVADRRDGLAALDALGTEDLVDVQPGLESRARACPPSVGSALRLLESAVQSAAYIVFGLAQHNPDRQGMGTTLTALLVRGPVVLWAQVGDSRIYRLRQGQVEQLTEDHTLVAWQLKQGLITEAEAQQSRQRNIITRAVGSREYVQVDTQWLPACTGDRYLLCSDGLHGYVHAEELAVAMQLDVEAAVANLTATANERGGRDNITALVVEIGS